MDRVTESGQRVPLTPEQEKLVIRCIPSGRRMTALRLLAAPRHTRSIFMEGYKEMRLGFERRA